jgi:hypothetical protein
MVIFNDRDADYKQWPIPELYRRDVHGGISFSVTYIGLAFLKDVIPRVSVILHEA